MLEVMAIGKGKEQEEVQQLIQSVDTDGNNVALP